MGFLGVLTLILVGLAAYCCMRQGIFFGAAACFSTAFAGMIAFQLWPSIAPELETVLADGFLKSCEDTIALIVVFVLVFAGVFMGSLVAGKPEYGFSAKIDQVGGIVFGGLAAYLISGFLLCAVQALPLKEKFLGFTYDENGIAGRAIPADQVWLKFMNRTHRGAFSSGDDHSQMIQEFSKTCAHERRRPKPSTEPAPTPEPVPEQAPPPPDPNTLTPGKKDIEP